MSTEYGRELSNLIESEAARQAFMVLWREYQEGVVQVMDYDIQIISNILKVLLYLRENMVYDDFEKTLMWETQEQIDKLVELLEDHDKTDQVLRLDQQKLRSKTVGLFLNAIDFAKEKS